MTTDLRALDPRREHAIRNLRKGTVTNMDRARLGRDVKAGKLHIARLIQDPPDCVARAEIAKILRWAPGLGETGIARVLLVAELSPIKHLGSLTDRQRLALQLALRRERPTQWELWNRTAAV